MLQVEVRAGAKALWQALVRLRNSRRLEMRESREWVEMLEVMVGCGGQSSRSHGPCGYSVASVSLF